MTSTSSPMDPADAEGGFDVDRDDPPADGRADVAPPPVPEKPSTDAAGSARSRLITAMAVFTALRFGLIVVLTVALMLVVPFIIALAVAVVLQLPISMLVFARQRAAVNEALATSRSVRRAERAELRAALHGQDE